MRKVVVQLTFEKDDDLTFLEEIAETSKQELGAVISTALRCHVCRWNGNDWCHEGQDVQDCFEGYRR